VAEATPREANEMSGRNEKSHGTNRNDHDCFAARSEDNPFRSFLALSMVKLGRLRAFEITRDTRSSRRFCIALRHAYHVEYP